MKYNLRKRKQINYTCSDSESESELESDSESKLKYQSKSESKLKSKPNCEYYPNNKKNEFNCQLKEIHKIRTKREITLNSILSTNLDLNNKVILIEYLDILKHTDKHTEEYLRIKNKIYKQIKESAEITNEEFVTQQKLQKMTNPLCDTMLHKIINISHCDNIQLILYNKYLKLKNLNINDEEYNKTEEWINHVLQIPSINKSTNIDCKSLDVMLLHLLNILNKNMYGMKLIKERILELFCTMLINPKSNRKCMALVGPPGVGKTALAKSIAESMNLPFEQISFGGIKDPSYLVGHSSTYIGSKPGIFVEILKKMKIKNGVLLLDEIDKISCNIEGQQIYNVLLNILDYVQNDNFRDAYMPEIPIDLSQLFIIVTLNNIDNIDPILKDRLPLIYMKGYTLQEKIKISTDYIIPKIFKQLQFNKNEMIISEKTIAYIINKSKYNEDGVRQLERNLYCVFEKINVLKQINNKNEKTKKIKLSYNIHNFKIPFLLSKENIDILFTEYI
jgi:ATP-dependent Lon protease